MKVLVTGGTGFVGRRLSEALARRGDEVHVASRRPEAARRAVPGAKAVHPWPPPAPEALPSGLDAAVNLAGEPVAGRWTARRRRAIRDSRIAGTAALVGALGRQDRPPEVLLSASAVGYYGDRGEEVVGEEVGPGGDFLARLCRDWEAEARAAERWGARVALLRFGIVLGAEGGALPPMMRAHRLGLGGRLGSGRQWWAWVHVDDAVRLILHVLDGDLAGPVNVTAPHPVRQADFSRRLAEALHRPAFLWTPRWALFAAVGGFAAELVASRRAVPRAAERSGFLFRFDTIDRAFGDLLDQRS
ncbi:MAG: TIGR01777 family protein [Acidobacteria bacterium]|nr:MAG: TIGR01777 family protein [Acidobacteriota bacterium]